MLFIESNAVILALFQVRWGRQIIIVALMRISDTRRGRGRGRVFTSGMVMDGLAARFVVVTCAVSRVGPVAGLGAHTEKLKKKFIHFGD